MANFFLIDQSLKKIGGHHHDYVRSLAAATSEAGYQTTIGTHKRFESGSPLESFGSVNRIFRQTTYQPDSYLSGLKHLTRDNRSFLPDERALTKSKWYSWQRWQQTIGYKRHKRRRRQKIKNFAIDCETFFQTVIFEERDHVFFTTINEMELMGLAAFLSNHPRTMQIQWHLQFHFNVFDGRTPEYESQKSTQHALQCCFEAALSRVPYHQLNFYTTSETLANQFNRLQVARFEVLPYPLRPELFSPLPQNPQSQIDDVNLCKRPLKITCPGEIRREKGVADFLPKLVSEIWDDHIETGNVQIAVQRPLRKWPRPEKIQLAPATAENLTDDPTLTRNGDRWVEYLSHPLSDRDYLQLLQDTDIGLLLYESRAYFSRRAGVLSELLTCGKPVIVPAGSWLSDQIAEPNFQHIETLLKTHPCKRTITLADLNWPMGNVPLPGGVVSFDQGNHPFEIQFELMEDEHAFVLEFDWHWPQTSGVYCKCQLKESADGAGTTNQQIIGHRTNGMAPLVFFRAPNKHVHLQLTNAFHESTASIRQINVHTLDADAATAPMGAVGFIAADRDVVALGLDEMIKHIDHYRDSARRFSKQWRQHHQPQRTLNSLVQRSDAFSRAA